MCSGACLSHLTCRFASPTLSTFILNRFPPSSKQIGSLPKNTLYEMRHMRRTEKSMSMEQRHLQLVVVLVIQVSK